MILRSHAIRASIAEAEAPFHNDDEPYPITRPMILLAFLISRVEIPSFTVFRQWLDTHGLGRYREHLIDREHDGIFTRDQESINAFYFVFPRSHAKNARELEEAIVRLLSEEATPYRWGHVSVHAYSFDYDIQHGIQAFPSGSYLPRFLLNRKRLWYHDHTDDTDFHNWYPRRKDPLDPFRDNPPT